MVIGLCDRALGREASAESIRAQIRTIARDLAPKPHAHDPVAMPCAKVACLCPLVVAPCIDEMPKQR